MTILETVREITLKALDIPRFEQYTINTLRGQFGVANVVFLRQEEYMDTHFGVHTARLLNPPDIKISVESKIGQGTIFSVRLPINDVRNEGNYSG